MKRWNGSFLQRTKGFLVTGVNGLLGLGRYVVLAYWSLFRYVDPMSPILLFNTVVDMLAILIIRANENDWVGGLIPHLVEDAVAILQYVDDNVLFMEHNLEKTISMKTIPLILKQLSILFFS
jgi:hypothetical protein